MQETSKLLTEYVWGNPHSLNPSSQRTNLAIENARAQVLNFFSASPSEYDLIFTSGATGAFRLVAESYAWQEGDSFVSFETNHNSLLGVRLAAEQHSVPFRSLSRSEFEAALKLGSLENRRGLLALPALCNFSGELFPLAWTASAQACGFRVLLDAAALVGSQRLNLEQCPADFVALSFYKMFGYPTGLGALLVRRVSASCLVKRYFGGGTVAAAAAHSPYQAFRSSIHQRFEDGTLNFQSILAIPAGLRLLNHLLSRGFSEHTRQLADQLVEGVRALKHLNGREFARIYSPSPAHSGIVAFNLLDNEGRWIGYKTVENLAAINGFHIRTGCFCNPGACQKYLEISDQQVRENVEVEGHVCWDERDVIKGKPLGAVRVSFGFFSRGNDVTKFLEFLQTFFLAKQEMVSSSPPSGLSMAKEARLVELTVFPIKSCAGLSVVEWDLLPSGLRWDREWMLINAEGEFLSQKDLPQMSLVRPRFNLDKRLLRIECDGQAPLELSLDYYPPTQLALNVCGELQPARVYDALVNAWFLAALDLPCRLVRSLSSSSSSDVLDQPRIPLPQKPELEEALSEHAAVPTTSQTPSQTNSQQQVHKNRSFANEAAYLLVNEASVAALRHQSSCSQVTADIFRANLLVETEEAWAEDRWVELRLKEQLLFETRGGCNRCRMINVDKRTLSIASPEPLRTLSKIRRDKGRIEFGIHLALAPTVTCQRLAVGMVFKLRPLAQSSKSSSNSMAQVRDLFELREVILDRVTQTELSASHTETPGLDEVKLTMNLLADLLEPFLVTGPPIDLTLYLDSLRLRLSALLNFLGENLAVGATWPAVRAHIYELDLAAAHALLNVQTMLSPPEAFEDLSTFWVWGPVVPSAQFIAALDIPPQYEAPLLALYDPAQCGRVLRTLAAGLWRALGGPAPGAQVAVALGGRGILAGHQAAPTAAAATARSGQFVLRFGKPSLAAPPLVLTYNSGGHVAHSLLGPGLAPGHLTASGETYPSISAFLAHNSLLLSSPAGWQWGRQAFKRKPSSAPPDLCAVCYDAPCSIVFLESLTSQCAHLCCCPTCAAALADCPVCRAPIARRLPVFRAGVPP